MSHRSHTSWAMLLLLCLLLGLFAVGEHNSEAARRGIAWLLADQQAGGALDGLWHHPSYNAPGFPRVFYLMYHLYRQYFPLLALTTYQKVMEKQG